MNRPRAVIAEDYVLIQDMIREIIEPECNVVAAVEDGTAALEAVATHDPDLLLIDASLPFANGFAVAEKLQKTHPDLKIIFVTAHDEPAYVKRAFEIGASAYVLKGSIRRELVAAIREAVAGGQYASPALRSSH